MLTVVPGPSLGPEDTDAVLALCAAAFEEDVAELYATMTPVAHVLARAGGELVSHAMWVERGLALGGETPLRTAYVELVATAPGRQGQGFGTRVMERLAEAVRSDYPLAALCTGSPGFYARLGWRVWTGPLSVRLSSGALVPTPGEIVMVLDGTAAVAHRRTEPLSVEWREGELW